MEKISVAVADDHMIFMKAVVAFLEQTGDFKVNIQAANTADLLEKLKNLVVDVLLLDLYMPQFNTYDVLEIIHTKFPRIKILIVSMCTDMSLISNILNCGVHGYISKSDEPDELIKAIRSVYEDRIYRNSMLTDVLYWSSHSMNESFSEDQKGKFDSREKKILQMLWEEKSTKEIAEEIFVSIRSIEKIKQEMKEKLGVKSTIGLLKYGLRRKIIDLSI